MDSRSIKNCSMCGDHWPEIKLKYTICPKCLSYGQYGASVSKFKKHSEKERAKK